MSRLRYAAVIGTIGPTGLTTTATSHTFTAPLTYANGVTVPTLVSPDYFLLTILDTSGNLSEVVQVTAYNSSTGAATLVRGQQGSSGVAHSSGDKVTQGAYADDFAGVIAVVAYEPGTLASYTTAATSIADVDATNLAVTFTAPPSGKVLIRLEAVGGSSGAQSDNMSWGLRNGSTTVKSGLAASGHLSSGSSAANDSITKTFLVTGLTPGATLTYKWGWFVNTGSNTSRLFAGGTVGPAVMEVQAVPA